MKLDLTKRAMFEALSKCLKAYVTAEDFYEVIAFAETLEKRLIIDGKEYTKFSFYDLFSDDVSISSVKITRMNYELMTWLNYTTCNITKGFNRGRKVTRELKDFCSTYGDVLAFSTGVQHILSLLSYACLVDSTSDYTYNSRNQYNFVRNLSLILNYVRAVYKLNYAIETDNFDSICALFVMTEPSRIIAEFLTYDGLTLNNDGVQ